MGEPARVLDERYTYRDYRTWPDDERWELIDGTAYEISPSPSWRHQGMQLELAFQLKGYLRGKPCRVFVAPLDVILPAPDQDADTEDDDIDTVVQPDVLVICDRGKLGERAVRGAPDIAIEIMSPHSWVRDAKIKLDVYERRGIREYWMIDPGNRVISLFFRGVDGRFGRPRVIVYEGGSAGEFSSEVLPDFSLDIAALFDAAEPGFEVSL